MSATGCLPTRTHPVGGGVRILEEILSHLSRRFSFLVLIPGPRAGERDREGVRVVQVPVPLLQKVPIDRLLRFTAFEYARFSEQFEEGATEYLLTHRNSFPPGPVPVVSNDVAEGPNFTALRQAHFQLVTIFHVVVADFFTRIYLKGFVSPLPMSRLLTRMQALRLGWIVPRVLRLAFEKERQAVRHSDRLIVPSAGMVEALRRCYPECPEDRIVRIPWGISLRDESPPEKLASAREAIRRELDLSDTERVIVTMSRLSYEKGIELLLEALRLPEAHTLSPLCVIVCGEGAYMGGEQYVRSLKRLAWGVQSARVVFPGYVTGVRKHAYLSLAHLFVSCSKYEAYGLTIAEALSVGLPVLSTDHYGAREILRPEFGVVVRQRDPRIFLEEMRRLLEDPERLQGMASAAGEFGRTVRFEVAAEALAHTIQEVQGL